MHYNADNSDLFFDGKEMYKFKASNKNNSFPSQFCLGSISKKFDCADTEEVYFEGNVYGFSVDYDAIDKSNMYWLKVISKMFEIIEKMFIVLLTNIVNVLTIQNLCL